MIIYLGAAALLLIGLYCVAVKKNLIKIVMGITILEYAINLLWVAIGYRSGGGVDPLPQALALTIITIGLATNVILVALALQLYKRFGTFDITKIRRLKG
jgi:multicomponent Na+:H+ antiporter subunit C